jgi:hypothetical protein
MSQKQNKIKILLRRWLSGGSWFKWQSTYLSVAGRRIKRKQTRPEF